MKKKALFYNCNSQEYSELKDTLNEFEYEIKDDNFDEKISDYEIICVNLNKIMQQNAEFETDKIIENIDTTGISLIQNAAKNHQNTAILTDLTDCQNAVKEIKTLGEISPTLRESLAVKAFATCAKYNADISKTLSHEYKIDADDLFIAANRITELEQGENTHQKASLYDLKTGFDYKILNDKDLKYTDIIDLTVALDIVSEFYDVPACVLSNSGSPCGAALGKDLKDAYEKAFDCNTIASMGAVAAFSQTVTKDIAIHAKNAELRAIAAIAFEDDALEVLKKSPKTLIIEIKTPLKDYKNLLLKEYKTTPFGLLAQDCDKKDLDVEDFKIQTKTKPTKEQIEDLIFAFKIAKHLKSNAVVIAKDFKAISIENAHSCLLNAVEWGLNGAMDGTKEAVICLNGGVVTFATLNATAQGRISAILCPSDTQIPPTIFERADKFNLAFIETKTTHFRY